MLAGGAAVSGRGVGECVCPRGRGEGAPGSRPAALQSRKHFSHQLIMDPGCRPVYGPAPGSLQPGGQRAEVRAQHLPRACPPHLLRRALCSCIPVMLDPWALPRIPQMTNQPRGGPLLQVAHTGCCPGRWPSEVVVRTVALEADGPGTSPGLLLAGSWLQGVCTVSADTAGGRQCKEECVHHARVTTGVSAPSPGLPSANLGRWRSSQKWLPQAR